MTEELFSVGTTKSATISADGVYRYSLTRRWSHNETAFATFVMLNPSTADADFDDRTIRRCIGFAKAWGLGGLHVVNLYALRSTDPRALWESADPVGPENDKWIELHATSATNSGTPLIAAWGANAKSERVRSVVALPGMQSLSSLSVTKAGTPGHPLYLKGDSLPKPWAP